jgi:hypothetical protein
MTSSAEIAKDRVGAGKKDIAQQRLRVARWRKLLAKLERDEHPDVLVDARQRYDGALTGSDRSCASRSAGALGSGHPPMRRLWQTSIAIRRCRTPPVFEPKARRAHDGPPS